MIEKVAIHCLVGEKLKEKKKPGENYKKKKRKNKAQNFLPFSLSYQRKYYLVLQC